MIGQLTTIINPAIVVDAMVRASAGILMLAHPDDPRGAKLTAATIEHWTPEFIAAVQRRIDRAHAIQFSIASGNWTIDAAKLRAYHEKLKAAGMPPCLDLPR
jgi:hypothetical protein